MQKQVYKYFFPLFIADGSINRNSHEGPYRVANSLPLNIRGRTGLQGRGVLGRYGPNHAADPIVTRWKRDERGKQVYEPSSGRPVLQFVSIQRKDTNEWAIPGGIQGHPVQKGLKKLSSTNTFISFLHLTFFYSQ